MRDPGPVPVTSAIARVVPPDHVTRRLVRVPVFATTAWGEASVWPFTRGRPLGLGVRRGGGAYRAVSPENWLTLVR
jgi:hypothetical protein